jgi:hypothetical protein
VARSSTSTTSSWPPTTWRSRVFSLKGGSDIYLPEDLRVEISDIGVMGGNEIQRGAPKTERRDGPVVRLIPTCSQVEGVWCGMS